jgi:hypothetical protein
MQNQDIQVLCDVYCKWHDHPPVYRCWVNDELFAERTWIWKDVYLEEQLQICAPVGTYTVRYELVNNSSGKLKVRNIRVIHGSARMIGQNVLEVYHENS